MIESYSIKGSRNTRRNGDNNNVEKNKNILKRPTIIFTFIYYLCSPIYNPEEWSPSGEVYVGGMHRKPSQNNCLELLIATLYFSVVSVLEGTCNLPPLISAGKTGLFLWAITLAGILLGGALLVYNTSALAS